MSSVSATAKSGNVLVLLDLYTSGFATSVTPTIPQLTSRTMHALYALSFLIYSTNSVCNWLHVYCVLQGYITSFPLKLWFSLSLVIVAVGGSMLNILLMMLCVENAFAHRLDLTVYKTGFSVIWESILDWIHSFNNFRVAFLFMLLHDAPITLANYFLISTCRCAGPYVLHWPVFVSTLSVLISVIWRMVMLFYAYNRLVIPRRRKSGGSLSSRQPSFRNHFEASISLSDGGRLSELDETWPIRWSIATVYGEYPMKCALKTVYVRDSTEQRRSIWSFCGFWTSFIFLKTYEIMSSVLKKLVCAMCILITYGACITVGCLPCIYFYTCRRNSVTHRHKCSKNFVKFASLAFHYFVLGFSIACSLLLIIMNIVLMCSVQVFGSNNVPPEISRVCISIDYDKRIIRPSLLSTPPFLDPSHWQLPGLLFPNSKDVRDKDDLLYQQIPTQFCKPLWERPDSGIFRNFGFNRQVPGPWQMRIPLDRERGEILAVSTHFVSNYTNRQLPWHVLYYDFALLQLPLGSTNTSTVCRKNKFSGWFFANALNQLDFPYFFACSSSIRVRKGELIDCRSLMQLT